MVPLFICAVASAGSVVVASPAIAQDAKAVLLIQRWYFNVKFTSMTFKRL
jgi:hypothetical protein